MIEQTNIEGRSYYTATARGVEYTASEDCIGWGVWSHRLALGRGNVGGFKRYASLAELSAKCKALAGLDALIAAPAVAA